MLCVLYTLCFSYLQFSVLLVATVMVQVVYSASRGLITARPMLRVPPDVHSVLLIPTPPKAVWPAQTAHQDKPPQLAAQDVCD